MSFGYQVLQFGVGQTSTVWTYASTSAAESSGDPWVNGDTVQITGGPTFIYLSGITTVHSGLVHKEPYGSGNGTVTAIGNNRFGFGGTDPDTWSLNGGGTGTKGVDWDYDTNGGSARFRDISTGTAGNITAFPATAERYLETADEHTMLVVDALRGTMSNPFLSSINTYLNLNAYNPVGGDYTASYIYHGTATSSPNWRIYDLSGDIDTGLAFTTARRVYMYASESYCTFWFDDDSSPTTVVTPQTAAFSASSIPSMIYDCGSNTSGISATLELGYHELVRLSVA